MYTLPSDFGPNIKDISGFSSVKIGQISELSQFNSTLVILKSICELHMEFDAVLF